MYMHIAAGPPITTELLRIRIPQACHLFIFLSSLKNKHFNLLDD